MTGKPYSPGRILLALLSTAWLHHGQATSLADWEGCSTIPADIERLACYDRVSGRSQPEAAPVPEADAKGEAQPVPLPVTAQLVAPEADRLRQPLTSNHMDSPCHITEVDVDSV